MTVDGIKKRILLFEQFDHYMIELLKELGEFKINSKTLIREKQESIKLYGHAFNLAWTLYNCIDVFQRYETEIKNSLFYGRYEKNKENAEEFHTTINEIIFIIDNIMQSFCLDDVDDRLPQLTDELDKEKLLSDSKYLSKLKRHLSRNGNKILSIVCFYLRCLDQLLTSIKNFRANLTDDDYRFLFEREFKDYLAADEWSDLESSFIENTINRKFHGSEPSQDQLGELLSDEYCKIEDMSDSFGIIEPYIEEHDKLGRVIIQGEFETDINTPILELFRHLGRIEILKKWIEQLESEVLCYEPLENDEQEFCYKEKYSEDLSKKTFPEILKLFENRKPIDWVCFYHVLVCYNYIDCLDFNAFNRWLTNLAGRELIAPGYARGIKMQYWAQHAKYVWRLEDALKYKNSKQQESKYREYSILCDQILEILKKG